MFSAWYDSQHTAVRIFSTNQLDGVVALAWRA